jgi:fructokinase
MESIMQVLSIGEILWDVFPDRELLGGAPLNFSANCARLGNLAALISGVGDDDRGRRALDAAATLGVDTRFLHIINGQPTGVALVTTGPGGDPRFEIPRPAAFDFVDLSQEELASLKLLQPDWLYFGTLVQTDSRVEEMTRNLARSIPGIRCFYDLNLRPGAWSLSLVERLCPLASVLKLNEVEATTLGTLTGMGFKTFTLEAFCAEWASRYGLDTICITLGAAGCLVYQEGSSHRVPGFPSVVRDTVGAGDAFAAGFLDGYHQGWPAVRTARFANALGSIVASRPGATPEWSIEECFRLTSSYLETDYSTMIKTEGAHE